MFGFKIKGDFSTRQYTIILFLGEVMATFPSLYKNKIFNFLTQISKFKIGFYIPQYYGPIPAGYSKTDFCMLCRLAAIHRYNQSVRHFLS